MKMKIWALWVGLVAIVGVVAAFATGDEDGASGAAPAVCWQEDGKWADLEPFLLFSPEPGDSAQKVDWEMFAQTRGIAKEELAAKIAGIAKNGLVNNSDDFKARLGESALWELARVGGEKEYAFVHDTMQRQGEKYRHIAMYVLFRMVPAKWEDLVREIVADEKYSDYDRFLAYEEAVRVGRSGDLNTRRRVIEVLEEMRSTDTSKSNRNSIGLGLTELKGEGWEEWLRKVTMEDGFTSADRTRAYDLAFRIGRDGDEKTRQHVLAVLKEMWDQEAERGVKNILGMLIRELENH